MLIFKPWKNSRRCDNLFDPIHIKCRRETDLYRSITFCGPETALPEDTDSAHMPELQSTFWQCYTRNTANFHITVQQSSTNFI